MGFARLCSLGAPFSWSWIRSVHTIRLEPLCPDGMQSRVALSLDPGPRLSLLSETQALNFPSRSIPFDLARCRSMPLDPVRSRRSSPAQYAENCALNGRRRSAFLAPRRTCA